MASQQVQLIGFLARQLPGGTTAVYRGAARVLVDVEEVPAILHGVVYGVVDDSALGEEHGRVTLLTGDALWR